MAYAIFFRDPVSYADGLRIQQQLHLARSEDKIPDTVLLLQHRPVITLGRRRRDNHLLVHEAELKKRGIDLFESSRGGDVTYHGPGQVVVYPIIKLGRKGAGSHSHLFNLEEMAIRTCASYGVDAWRREGKSGAWTAKGKIAAIGFKLQRWVTLHGMSFNVEQDLQGFSLIVPCGLVGEPVSSLRGILAQNCPALDDVAKTLAGHFEAISGQSFDSVQYGGALPAPLAAVLS